MRDGGMNPRLLLVEDDPVSQAFLAEAARELPAEVDCANTIAEAMRVALQHRYDAWLIDANLPDGHGVALLAKLRDLHSFSAYALAHTASKAPEDIQTLLGAGFDAVVSKPLSATEWQAAIRNGLGVAKPPTWDDASALQALSGNGNAVASLRALFLAELPKQHSAILSALETGDAKRACDELHRMKASCGFVGASLMRAAVDALHANPTDLRCRVQFDAAIEATLDARSAL